VIKRVAALLALVLGFLGLVACMAGIYVVWRVGAQLQETNEKVFTAVDKGLAFAQDRIRGVQNRVEDSKITSNQIAQRVREWSKAKAKERLVAELEIERRTESLARHLQTADLWLETTTESIRGVQQVLELAHSVGSQVDPASLAEVLEKLTSIRSMLQQTEGTVEDFRGFAVNNDAEAEENRQARILKLLGRALLLLGRALLMISEVDIRLAESQARLSELRTNAQDLKSTMRNYILLTTIVCLLLVAWIAAGQAALFLTGWKNRGQSRSSA
jgi:hypothetical protein